MSCGGSAAVVQTCAFTAVDAFLTADALATFFASRSAPYAVFATDFATLPINGASTLNSAGHQTQGNVTIDRRGDKLAKIYLNFVASPIVNVTVEACTRGGQKVPVAGGTDNGSVLTRAIIGAPGPKHFKHVLSATSTMTEDVNNLVVNATLGVTADALLLRVGDVVHLSSSGVAGQVPSKTYIKSITLDAAGVATGVIVFEQSVGIGVDGVMHLTFEREVHRGMIGADSNAYSYEDADVVPCRVVRVEGPTFGVGTATSVFRYRGPGGDPTDIACYYRTFAAATLVNQVQLMCGTQCLDVLTSSALIIYHECFVPRAKQGRRMMNISKDKAELKSWALQPNVWRMLLPFHMCTSYSKALSLVSICLHNLKLNITFNPAMWAVGNGVGAQFAEHSSVATGDLGDAATGTTLKTVAFQSSKSLSGITKTGAVPTTAFSGASISVSCMVEFIYSGKSEREMEVNLSEKLVVIEHQQLSNQIISTSGAKTIALSPSHPISAIFITAVSHANYSINDRQNYSGDPDPMQYCRGGIVTDVPLLSTVCFNFNSSKRTPETDRTFYCELQHGNIAQNTSDHIWAYYFGCADPHNHQHAGSANLSRMDSASVTITANGAYFADQSGIGGANYAASTVGEGAMSQSNQIYVNIDFTSINVWTFEGCMLGRMFA
jgi:hypothetical protein